MKFDFKNGKIFSQEMNYKLEKFWNKEAAIAKANADKMNYKLEKFWN